MYSSGPAFGLFTVLLMFPGFLHGGGVITRVGGDHGVRSGGMCTIRCVYTITGIVPWYVRTGLLWHTGFIPRTVLPRLP